MYVVGFIYFSCLGMRGIDFMVENGHSKSYKGKIIIFVMTILNLSILINPFMNSFIYYMIALDKNYNCDYLKRFNEYISYLEQVLAPFIW